MKQFVAYYRLSKLRVGSVQYGIQIQKDAVQSYLRTVPDAELVGSFEEIETGKDNSRPQLALALALAKAKRATIIIGKLDRLSRNAAFLLSLRDSNLEIVCCDMPNADRLTIGVMALVSEREREMISARVKAGLAVAARTKTLGNPRLADARKNALAVIKAQRLAFAQQARKTLMEIQETGVTSYNRLALYMQRRGEPTPRGGAWTSTTVKRILTATS